MYGRHGRALAAVDAGMARAMTAHPAGGHVRAVRVGVVLRRIGRGHGKGVVAQLGRGFGEFQAAGVAFERGQIVFARARALERVASGPDRATHIARRARHRGHGLEAREVRLQLLPAHAPVLDGHVVGHEIPPIAFRDVGAQAHVGLGGAETVSGPGIAGPAETLGRVKRADAPHWERRAGTRVAEGQRAVFQWLGEARPHAVEQGVVHAFVGKRVVLGVARSALQPHNIQAFAGELHCGDGARPAKAHDHHVRFGQAPRVAPAGCRSAI